MTDAEDRERWRKLHLLVQGPSITLSDIDQLLTTLAASGSLEETLLARRAAIDTELERASRRRAGLATAIRERAARDHDRLEGKAGPA